MRVEPYTGLAGLYDTIGLAAYSEALIPRLIDMAFTTGWVGRTMLDLGCGTGEVACFLARQGYRVIACDSSTAMLGIGAERAKSDGLTVEWLHGNIQTLQLSTSVDLALMLGGTFNLLPNLSEMEQALSRIAAALDPGKLFIFDLDTVRGLIDPRTATDILYNEPDQAFVVAHSQIDYEQLVRTTEYTIFNRNLSDNNAWRSFVEIHAQRALPFAAIKRYLGKAGLSTLSVLSPGSLTTVDPEESSRIVVIAQKLAAKPAAPADQ